MRGESAETVLGYNVSGTVNDGNTIVTVVAIVAIHRDVLSRKIETWRCVSFANFGQITGRRGIPSLETKAFPINCYIRTGENHLTC